MKAYMYEKTAHKKSVTLFRTCNYLFIISFMVMTLLFVHFLLMTLLFVHFLLMMLLFVHFLQHCINVLI